LVADQALDIQLLKEVNAKKWQGLSPSVTQPDFWLSRKIARSAEPAV
jgi:hypothetical protein